MVMEKTNKPKLIKKWKDKIDNISNYHYQYPNGVPLVVSIDESSNETCITAYSKAGAIYETKYNVPQGIAHFLEHMLLNPNKKFKSFKDINNFKYGNKERSSIYTNGFTSLPDVEFVCISDKTAFSRMVEFMKNIIDYPEERFSEFIENERNIIHAELSDMVQIEKDVGLISLNFIRGEIPIYNRRVIGTHESIDQINIEHLKKYKKVLFNNLNLGFSVYTPSKLNKEEWNNLNQFVCTVPNREKNYEIKMIDIPIKRKKDYFNYNNDLLEEDNVFISINLDFKYYLNLEYKATTIKRIVNRMIAKLIEDYLREDQGLVYSVETIGTALTWNYGVIGLKISCGYRYLEKVINDLDLIIYDEFEDYLRSSDADYVLDSLLSEFIYPITPVFNIYYANELLYDVFHGYELGYDADVASNEAKTIKMVDILKFYKKYVQKKKPAIWIESKSKEQGIIEIMKDSKITRRFGLKY